MYQRDENSPNLVTLDPSLTSKAYLQRKRDDLGKTIIDTSTYLLMICKICVVHKIVWKAKINEIKKTLLQWHEAKKGQQETWK